MRILPTPVDLCTQCTNKMPTVAAEAGCNTLFALLTLGFVWLFDFLYRITNLKEIEIKRGLQPQDTS